MAIELIGQVKIEASSDLYKIVNILNKQLKYDDLMFGLAKDEDDEDKMVFTIYRT